MNLLKQTILRRRVRGPPRRRARAARGRAQRAPTPRVPRLNQTPRMALPHLFRVILPVSDIEAAASFYARLLAMPGTRVSSGRHYFDCGGHDPRLLPRTGRRGSRAGRPESPHPSTSVSTTWTPRMGEQKQAGCRELTGIELRPWGERSFYARDPFKNPICFVDSQTLFTGEHA